MIRFVQLSTHGSRIPYPRGEKPDELQTVDSVYALDVEGNVWEYRTQDTDDAPADGWYPLSMQRCEHPEPES